MNSFFTQFKCVHCGRTDFPSNAALYMHRVKAHPAQEGRPTPEFRGRGDGTAKAQAPRTYTWFGSDPPKAVLEHATLMMSDPDHIIRHKQDNWPILEDQDSPPHVIVRSKYVKGGAEEDIAYRVSLMQAQQERDKAATEVAEAVPVVSEVLDIPLTGQALLAQQLAEYFGIDLS